MLGKLSGLLKFNVKLFFSPFGHLILKIIIMMYWFVFLIYLVKIVNDDSNATVYHIFAVAIDDLGDWTNVY